MQSLMMDTPLTITEIMRFADTNYGHVEVVSVTQDQPLHRCRYADVFRRSRQLANALRALGLSPNDRVATLAWNDYRHLELYYAVSSAGYVLHTVNPRLYVEQITYILNHAADRVIFLDPMFVPLLEGLAEHLTAGPQLVVLTDRDHMPESSLKLLCYDELLAEQATTFDWPDLDERAASALCYTSGTTGNPKGVLYNHRSTVLHAYAAATPNVMAMGHNDSVLAVVPMFHANAWGTPYIAPMVGAKMVFPGPRMGDGETLQGLIEGEGVTIALGVPTVWLGLLNYLKQSGKTVPSLNRTVVGGAACPLSIMQDFEQQYGVYTHHAWGMTEMSPLGTFNTLLPGQNELPPAERDAVRASQGRAVFGVDMRIVDDDDNELPRDGEAFGALQVRGPWICSGYFQLEGDSDAHTGDGWFSTGDVATIDELGFMRITDRTKDVIKSGGEWISSIELENQAVAHPEVAEAAVIGVSHAKWSERPLLIVVKEPDANVSREDLLTWLEDKVAKWWIPDDVAFVDELPHTATGKIHKVTLREQFADYRFPTE